jgi:hypothetical protein
MVDIADLVDDEFISGCLQMLSMLHLCEYPLDVTMMTLAVASVYGADGSVRQAFDEGSSRGLTLFCMYTFLAHTYLVDEWAFLQTWYDYVFRTIMSHDYVCDMDDLNSEIVGFIRQRKSGLYVDAPSAEEAYSTLVGALERTTEGLLIANEMANKTCNIRSLAVHGV